MSLLSLYEIIFWFGRMVRSLGEKDAKIKDEETPAEKIEKT